MKNFCLFILFLAFGYTPWLCGMENKRKKAKERKPIVVKLKKRKHRDNSGATKGGSSKKEHKKNPHVPLKFLEESRLVQVALVMPKAKKPVEKKEGALPQDDSFN